MEHHPEDQLGEKSDHASNHHRDDQHAHVAVADVGQLVSEYGFELGIVDGRYFIAMEHVDGLTLLRLAQPVSPRRSSHGMDVSGWFARAASVLTPLPGQVLDVRPSEFAPSQWLVGH